MRRPKWNPVVDESGSLNRDRIQQQQRMERGELMTNRFSKREQYERLARPDQDTLDAFAELGRAEQLEIIRTIEEPARNPKVAKSERELAKRRAAAYRKYLKPEKDA